MSTNTNRYLYMRKLHLLEVNFPYLTRCKGKNSWAISGNLGIQSLQFPATPRILIPASWFREWNSGGTLSSGHHWEFYLELACIPDTRLLLSWTGPFTWRRDIPMSGAAGAVLCVFHIGINIGILATARKYHLHTGVELNQEVTSWILLSLFVMPPQRG